MVGSVDGGPSDASSACSPANWAGVRLTAPTGLSGPVTPVNSPLLLIDCSPAAIACASSQAGCLSL